MGRCRSYRIPYDPRNVPGWQILDRDRRIQSKERGCTEGECHKRRKKYSSTNIRRVSERIEETIAYRFKPWFIHLARSMICHRLILYRDHFDQRLITENLIKTYGDVLL